MIERISNNQLVRLILANVKELIREPGVLFWGIVFPILMSLGLGVAFTKKKDVVTRIAVIGQNHLVQQPGDTTSALLMFLISNKAIAGHDKEGNMIRTLTVPDDKLGNTTFIFHSLAWKEAMVMLKRGNLNLVLDEKNGMVQYHFDPMNPEAQLTYLKISRLLAAPCDQGSQHGDQSAHGKRHPLHRLPCTRAHRHGGDDVVHVGSELCHH
jgi:hypothetical protein